MTGLASANTDAFQLQCLLNLVSQDREAFRATVQPSRTDWPLPVAVST